MVLVGDVHFCGIEKYPISKKNNNIENFQCQDIEKIEAANLVINVTERTETR